MKRTLTRPWKTCTVALKLMLTDCVAIEWKRNRRTEEAAARRTNIWTGGEYSYGKFWRNAVSKSFMWLRVHNIFFENKKQKFCFCLFLALIWFFLPVVHSSISMHFCRFLRSFFPFSHPVQNRRTTTAYKFKTYAASEPKGTKSKEDKNKK